MSDPLPTLFAPNRPYKDFEPVMGVWAIRHLASGRIFLGTSLHTAGALNRHVFTLRLGTHRNAALQRDWNEHGEAAFTTEILHVLDRVSGRTETDNARDLQTLERLWLEELQPYGDAGYNPPARD
ncbi:GIY-YIG nuclease family protein [Deinococcus oregonensis]|uniref:GIY-YIG nuclease family protein n=1 Tax=Deinococcus oregonensis TaxID=1805970 RepID=A0ABV6AVG3_9DEIO